MCAMIGQKQLHSVNCSRDQQYG